MARSPKHSARPVDPYCDLEVGHHVMLSSPLVDPILWHPGQVLWRDHEEVLVDGLNFAGKIEKHLRSIRDVRVFGTRDHCDTEQRKAQAVVRNAADLAQEIEDLGRDLRHRMTVLFEEAAKAALKACGAQS